MIVQSSWLGFGRCSREENQVWGALLVEELADFRSCGVPAVLSKLEAGRPPLPESVREGRQRPA